MSPEHRGLLAICDLRQEVNSGGFDGYFSAWGGDSAPDALGALPPILGQEWADLLDAAMRLLGETYPSGADEREDLIGELELDDELDALDTRYYALESRTDADATLSSYLEAHPV